MLGNYYIKSMIGENCMTDTKKAIIIGGGVSGLTTGIYLRKSGYDVEILEKNAIPGGACVGWERKGCYIDGCIHWLVGTKPGNPYYEFWRETHALEEDTPVFFHDAFSVFDFPDGKKLTVYADIDKFEKEMLEFAPEDEKEIKKLVRMIKRFRKIEGPVDKPVDMMSIFRLIKVGLTMAGDYYHVAKYSKVDCVDYGKRFKNKYIRYLFANYMAPGYNLMSMLYMLSHVMNKDGGIPVGGSEGMSRRMANYFAELGGVVRYNSEAERVIVEHDRAVGVELKNGVRLYADWVISTTAAEHCMKKLLRGAYRVKKMDERWADTRKYPIYTMTIAAYKCSRKLSQEEFPLGLHGMLRSPVTVDKEYAGVAIRNYSYDPTLKCPDGSTVLQVQILGDDDMYFWWKNRKERGTYRSEKARIAEEIKQKLYERYPSLEGTLDTIDVITPCTYERYLNTRHGSFQGFVHTATGKQLMQKGIVPGLKGFMLSGQCIFQSGGLPPAAITGRFAAQRICKADGRPFMTKTRKENMLAERLRALSRKKATVSGG